MVRLLDSAVVQSEIKGKFYFCEATSLGYHFFSVVEVLSFVERSGAFFSCFIHFKPPFVA